MTRNHVLREINKQQESLVNKNNKTLIITMFDKNYFLRERITTVYRSDIKDFVNEVIKPIVQQYKDKKAIKTVMIHVDEELLGTVHPEEDYRFEQEFKQLSHHPKQLL